jgi:hypothetical protein
MVSATKYFDKNDYIIRIDALNFCFDVDTVIQMINEVNEDNFDLIKFVDNWPPIFTADIYKINVLRELSKYLSISSPFQIHPKYHIIQNKDYKSRRILPDIYSNHELEKYRRQAKFVYEERELGSSNNSIRT